MRESSIMSRRGFLAGAALFAGALAGCDANNTPSDNENDQQAEDSQPTTSSSGGSSATSANGNVLVAYYSAQGHTEAVAQTIADELGADLFEITPTEPYSDDDLNYNDPDSRVSREHEDEGMRDVELTQVTLDGWDGYDTVLVGYPIWWGIAAWPVDNFIAGNDWGGKTVIPFCTSASSGLGQSGELLAEAAGTGDWQEGRRFSQNADEDEVRSWAASLS